MPRYFVRAGSYVEDDLFDSDKPMLPHVSVPDHEPLPTGLLDQRGEDIWRSPNPIGFGRDEEW